jgi:tellurite resistance protein TerC
MTHTLPSWAWGAFSLLIAGLLALDLGVFQREAHEIKVKEALAWCGGWLALALGFDGLLYAWRGAEPAQQFLAAYLVEFCLSADNVFVFILIFACFKVAPRWQHRVLFWGIIGAATLRSVFILVGVGVIARCHWILYLFGAFLVYTGGEMVRSPAKKEGIHPEKNAAVRLCRRWLPVSAQPAAGRFFTREGGRCVATPFLIVLIVVETTDLLFALDSLPAVLAITTDGFVALTSNIFAILGLRSLYFALSGLMLFLRHLKTGLAVILCFIGAKMLIQPWLEITTAASLGVIGAVLAVAVLASVLFPGKTD